MKKVTFIFAGLAFVLCACPPGDYQGNLSELQNNNMDFPEHRTVFYKGVKFDLATMFDADYNDGYTLTDDPMARIIYEMNINFSVELFDENWIEEIQYSFDEEIDPLDAVHDYYITERMNSLQDPIPSAKKELPKDIKLDGIQTIHGADYSYEDESSYFTATVLFDEQIFVFQMIGKKENMGYLYDDFEELLRSIH